MGAVTTPIILASSRLIQRNAVIDGTAGEGLLMRLDKTAFVRMHVIAAATVDGRFSVKVHGDKKRKLGTLVSPNRGSDGSAT